VRVNRLVKQFARGQCGGILTRLTIMPWRPSTPITQVEGAGLLEPHRFSAPQAFVVEAILSLGLISTILGTASSAQNIGPLSAFGVTAYIVLAGHGDAPR
jgi:glycerol uptake facilitator-like aquaporin